MGEQSPFVSEYPYEIGKSSFDSNRDLKLAMVLSTAMWPILPSIAFIFNQISQGNTGQ